MNIIEPFLDDTWPEFTQFVVKCPMYQCVYSVIDIAETYLHNITLTDVANCYKYINNDTGIFVKHNTICDKNDIK